MSLKDGLNKVTNFFRKAIKIFSSVIGQIIFFIIAALLIGVLVYVIVTVILKDVAKIIGIDGGAQSGNESYKYLQQLTSSGYDSMLNAQELIDYHAFEYAVLMDAARFMEETGTIPFEVTDTAALKIGELPQSLDLWAFLVADAFKGDFFNSTSGYAATNGANYTALR